MPKFHETVYGKRFFDSQLPRLIDALEHVAAALEGVPDEDPSVAANIADQRAHRDAKVDAHLATRTEAPRGEGAYDFIVVARDTLDTIAHLMDATEWNVDTLNAIADELRNAGYTLNDPGHSSHNEGR